MLPARFLADFAVYMQTCAHIELAVWHIIQLARNEDTETEQHLASHLRLKMSAYDLRKELRKASRLCPAHIGIRICDLANKIDEGFENRNMAAHGAWHVDQTSGKYRVEHYWKRGPKQSAQFFHMAEPITQRQVDVAVEEADTLLRSCVDVRSVLFEWRARRGEGEVTMIGRALSDKGLQADLAKAWATDIRNSTKLVGPRSCFFGTL